MNRAVSLLLWLLDHLALGPHAESLAGDLEEELTSGRSVIWFFYQALGAIALGLWNRIHDRLLALAFASGWSALYTLWQFFSTGRLTPIDITRYAALNWPYSSSMEIVTGVLPAVTFIWLGLLFYILVRSDRDHRATPFHITLGLSVSLSVLLTATMGLMHHLSDTGLDLRLITRSDFYLTLHLFAISIPLALSLFTAILLSFPHTPRSSAYRTKLAR
jgi:hypothetical protein